MNTKTIAIIATFAALTIVLNLSPVKIPAPYAPYLIYQLWEIPIVAAFLLFGITVGLTIALMNTAILFAVFPGTLPTGPLYNLAAVISMLSGLAIIKLLAKKNQQHGEAFKSTLAIALGITFRVAFMTLVNWTFLRYPVPIGFSMPEMAILGALPLIAIFNATLAFYTILLGYLVAKTVQTSIKIPA